MGIPAELYCPVFVIVLILTVVGIVVAIINKRSKENFVVSNTHHLQNPFFKED